MKIDLKKIEAEAMAYTIRDLIEMSFDEGNTEEEKMLLCIIRMKVHLKIDRENRRSNSEAGEKNGRDGK
jgi:hypothetical protein